ncbi:phycocyanin alpha phycocyanobilin lyase CpcE [Streptomyces azureus]|uniref:Phycocyanin alpha phycocyanobilin lyase CpcE n=1 Tax=Streptomyces azureus TaxID=146537 RepID=A0A0K8PE12_STRAJ|nr:phycocyanin alpha phycocyanobilin lyase CpcE [Streptomyces azureus]
MMRKREEGRRVLRMVIPSLGEVGALPCIKPLLSLTRQEGWGNSCGAARKPAD